MNWLERFLIIGGVSLDVFAAMEREGSLVAKIEKKGLFFACLLASAWQAAALCAGNYLAAALVGREWAADKGTMPAKAITVAAFAGLGVHLATKALKSDRIDERRAEQFDSKGLMRSMAGTGGYMLLAGIAFGLVGTDAAAGLLLAVGLSVAAVIAGAYTGYRFGDRQTCMVYAAGAVLLWVYCLWMWFGRK